MPEKEFKTIDAQLNILKERGLSIADEDEAKLFLKRNNYYRISGYSLTIRSHDNFHKNASFQNIIDIYNFDHEMRHILLKYIEIIEVQFKSVYAYEFAKVHGASGYMDEQNFSNINRYTRIMEKAEEQKKKRLEHEAYLKHYIIERQENLPLWAFVDLLTIADISFLYAITEVAIQKEIAAEFDIHYKILGKFMHSMTIIRNLCAHGSRLYNRLFEQRPNLNKVERKLLMIVDGEEDNAHLYGFIMLMKRLLGNKRFNELKLELESLTDKYQFVNMKYYGFREDWKQVL